MFGFNYFNTQAILRKNIEHQLQTKSEVIFVSIDRFLDERLNDVIDFKKQTLLYSKNNYFSNHDLKQFLIGQHYFESITFFSPERLRLADSDGIDIGKKQPKGTYWTDLTANSIVTDISLSECRKKDIIHIGTEVRQEGKLIGYLVARISKEHVYELFDFALQNTNDKNLEVELISKEGQLLYSNKGFTNRFSTKRYSKTRNNNKLIENENVLKSIHFKNGFNNYKGTDWVLVLTAQKKDVFIEMTKQAKHAFLVIAIVLAIVIVASIFFSYRLTKPIRKLTKTAQKLGNGELITTPVIKGNNELGILARTLAEMAIKIDQKITSLDELNQKLNKQFLKEKEQKRLITSSIECAKRIQNALLPTTNEIEKSGLNIDISFRPRNTVSGDFYYIKTIEKDSVIYDITAAIDCTGHGVPGAFMTIIANSLLHQIVEAEKIVNPIEIIKRMDQRLFDLFNKSSAKNEVREGMDISIIVYNRNINQIQFGGANQRLLHLKNKNHIHEYKGLKAGLGDGRIFKRDDLDDYLVSFHFNENDLLALYSDGITDQFGGMNKKYSTKKLRDTICNNSHLNSHELTNLLEQDLIKWKGKTAQTDDMLLILIEHNSKQVNYIENEALQLYA